MDWQETLANAKGNMGLCKVCPVCDGRVCKNTIPGPGAKGRGDVAMRNYEAWQNIRVNMDTLHANVPVSTEATLFGHTFKIPVFVGDGVDPTVIQAGTAAIARSGGIGVPTVKPWDLETVRGKMQLASDCGAFAIAMDVDAAGLPFLQNRQPPAGSKSVDELRDIVNSTDAPFIVKGVMTPRAAAKAAEAGAAGIVVSNHGGRVLDGTPSTAEVLPAIVREVDNSMVILVDGGIRSGLDIFKALALGADGVIMARPFVTAVYGGQAEGVAALVAKLQAELVDAMRMTDCATLADIDGRCIWG